MAAYILNKTNGYIKLTNVINLCCDNVKKNENNKTQKGQNMSDFAFF